MKYIIQFWIIVSITFPSFSQDTSGASKIKAPLRFEVKATLQTTPVISDGDAADDICVWVPDDPIAPLFIIGTDKKRGLETYNSAGGRIFEGAFGRINNVDIWSSSIGPIVAGSNRTYNSIDFYGLDTIVGSLRLLNRFPTGLEDVYGITVYQKDQQTQVFITDKKGKILRYQVGLVNQTVTARLLESYRFSSTVEGIKADPFYQRLYVAEEDKGLWIIDLSTKNLRREKIYKTDKKQLVADLEGVALLDLGGGKGYLFVSVQGANTYAIFDRETMELLAFFNISESEQIGKVEDTDGIEVINNSRFSYFIAQDGYNGAHQNYKMVILQDILSKMK